MKFNIYIALSFLLILFSACENELEKDLKFEVKVLPAENITITDSLITAPKGATLNFDFAGSPDFISFGYSRFNSINSTLSFSTQAAWGTHVQNTLNVFLCETSDTLLLNNPNADSILIANRQWVDISSLCNLPTAANITNKAGISLNNYRGKKICIAFRYKTDYSVDWQPTWTISNLQINDTIENSSTKTKTVLAATMGFKPFDFFSMTNPYTSAATAGVWNNANPSALVMTRTPAGGVLNTDWLISKPIEIDKGVNTLSANPTVATSSVIPIKNTTVDVKTYSYQFKNAGEYVVTFYASNANFARQVSTERKLKIIITE